MSSFELDELRRSALSDPTSSYYLSISKLLREMAARQKVAEGARRKCVVPVKLTPDERVHCERVFGCSVEVRNHGLTSRHVAVVQASIHLAMLRSLSLCGDDGEEVVMMDGNLATVVARGMRYAHVCRSSACDRLLVGYGLQGMQLGRLLGSSDMGVREFAATVSEQLKAGGGRNVCMNASACTYSAEVLVWNSFDASAPLATVIEAAMCHGASVVSTCFFFSPEMLGARSGPLSVFDGEYAIDESADTLTYIPRCDPAAAFSVRWSYVRTFFLNHECVTVGGRWLVEKHLGAHGVFHVVAHKVGAEWSFPEELGANYYSPELGEWVEFSFPTRFGCGVSASAAYWRRESVRFPKATWDKTLATLLAVDAKRLTVEEVLTVLRNHNNTVVVNGNTVRRPSRVWSDAEAMAAAPMLVYAMVRRESASAAAGALMSSLRRRYAVVDAGLLSLVWEAACALGLGVAGCSPEVMSAEAARELEEAVFSQFQCEMAVRPVARSVEVRQVVGGSEVRDYGGLLECFPARPEVRFSGVFARARLFAERGWSAMRWAGSARGEEPEIFFDAPEGVEPGTQAHGAVSVVEEVLPTVASASVTGMRRDLADKMIYEQDATVFPRVPREVVGFEGLGRVDVVPVAAVHSSVAAAQADYDSLVPGASVDDPVAKALVAAESDFERTVQFHGQVNDGKRELPRPRVLRRSVLRTAHAGTLPRGASALIAATFKRNAEVPSVRGMVDFSVHPAEAVAAIQRVCYRDGWQAILAKSLEDGLWTPCVNDIETYVPKVEVSKAERMLKEFFTVSEVDMHRWILMLKADAKPPVEVGAELKVQLPQTIMYHESKSLNGMYASMLSGFCDTLDEMLVPNVRLNHRKSPVEHERWFNTLQPLREACPEVHVYEGDSSCFDRSLDEAAFTLELMFYRMHGLDERTLHAWSETMGVKKATNLMYGFVVYIALQGISGIFKTIFRNMLVTLAAFIVSADLQREDIISGDFTGDDWAVELRREPDTGAIVRGMALRFNLSTKFFRSSELYICSRYWLRVNDWWYWVADPVRKFESLSAVVVCDVKTDEKLKEKWQSLRDDLRHYDDGAVMEALSEAVARRWRVAEPPRALVGLLARVADSKREYMALFGPEEKVG